MRTNTCLLVGLSFLFFSSCSPAEPFEPDESCDPPCSWWQTCSDRTCFANEGHCQDHQDCAGATPVCHETERVCVSIETSCSSCEPWQECSDGGQCVPAPGRCADASDCSAQSPICVSFTNTCVEASSPYTTSSWPAVIITSAALAPAFERLAEVHTLTGTATRVVTVEDICGSTCSTTDTRADAPARIKAWLKEQTGLRFVLLGGGIHDVPSRKVAASYRNSLLGVSFDEEFVTDFYYADLSEWDRNGNGIYAEPDDRPLAGELGILDYKADLAVARLPVDTAEEVQRYIGKVTEYLAHNDLANVRQTLLLSNVATTIMGVYDIDGGEYFEMEGRTIEVLPPDMDIVKLYALGSRTAEDALTLTLEQQKTEMERGPSFIVHAGHGTEDYLTIEEYGQNAFSGLDAFGLRNSRYPIMLSCACLAANFAHPLGQPAGARLVNAPNGGAIGYMGNTTIGLGLGGGSQIIDEFLRCAFESANPSVGDCLLDAHSAFTYPDRMTFPIIGTVTVVDEDSWRWTKKSVAYFGDPMIPIISSPSTMPAPAVDVSMTTLSGGSEFVFSISPPLPGTLTVSVAGERYLFDLDPGDEPVLRILEEASTIRYGFVSGGHMPHFEERSF